MLSVSVRTQLKSHGLHRRSFIVTSNCQKEQGYELEAIVEHIVHCVPYVSPDNCLDFVAFPAERAEGGHADLCFVPAPYHALRGERLSGVLVQ